MGTNLLSFYLKLNALLAVAWVLWWLIKRLAAVFGFESSQLQQLRLARSLFVGSLVLLPAIALLDATLPLWSKSVAGIVASREYLVIGALGQQQNDFSVLGIDVITIVLAVLAASLLTQGRRVLTQLRHLREIVANATPLRKIHSIELLVSTVVTSPFSTRVLGGKQIVLPADLLLSPRNLQLAVKHELQHVRNHDLEWVILLEAVKVLCSWNPAAWLWHNEFDCLQEFACDEVLVNQRHVSREGYGNCLLEVASVAQGSALLASSNMVPKFSFWQNHQHQLKRRILMLMQTGRKHSTIKTLCYGVLIGAGLLVEAGVVAGAESTAQGSDVVPVMRVNPDYPSQAIAERKEGWVQLQFSIAADGSVSEPKVIDHCVKAQEQPANQCDQPSDLFDETALAAISKWTYAASAKKDVETVLRFQLSQ